MHCPTESFPGVCCPGAMLTSCKQSTVNALILVSMWSILRNLFCTIRSLLLGTYRKEYAAKAPASMSNVQISIQVLSDGEIDNFIFI